MKGQLLSIVGALAATGSAAPGGCHDYSYDIPSCHSCYYPGHEFFGDSCYKECPKEYRQCKGNYHNGHDYRDGGYNSQSIDIDVNVNEEVYCPKDYRYDIQVKVESCSSGDYHGKDCLNVYYADSQGHHKRSSISESNLGIYLQQQSYYNPREFNYNNYCHGDRCEVPTEYLPNYPDLCEKEIYLAVGNNRCYDDYSYDDYSKSTKYIKVKVGCHGHHGHHDRGDYDCEEECCCYRS